MAGHSRIYRGGGWLALGARVASKEMLAMLGVVRTSPGSPSPRVPKGRDEENQGRANAHEEGSTVSKKYREVVDEMLFGAEMTPTAKRKLRVRGVWVVLKLLQQACFAITGNADGFLLKSEYCPSVVMLAVV